MKPRSIAFRAPPRVMAPLLAALLIAGCSSDERKAANEAASAQAALDSGQIGVARQYIQRALALRDDVSDYWLLMAHIALAGKDIGGAFSAYQNALQFDRANVEALTSLCQIALGANIAPQAVKYADQLALVIPASTLPNTVRAAAAAQRGDKARANQYLALVFAARPGDVGGLLVKAHMLADESDFAGAAKVVEQSLAVPGDPTSRLFALVEYYRLARDRDGLFSATERLARVMPDDPDIQLHYADLLFDKGAIDAANAAITRAARAAPNNIGIAAAALNLWLKQGRDAVPADRLAAAAADTPLALRAAYAQFASETGRPALAIRLLADANLAAGQLTRPEVANAAAALAYARGMSGDRAAADAGLAAVLAADPNNPWALLARGRLRAAAGDGRGALEDLRRAVAQDGANVAARQTLADVLFRSGEPLLAETALRDGMKAADDDPRLAATLARLQIAQGRRDKAAVTIAEFVRAHPLSRRAALLRAD